MKEGGNDRTTLVHGQTITTDFVSYTVININFKSCNTHEILSILYIFITFLNTHLADQNLWDKYKPQPVDVKMANVHDYYEICEELGTYVGLVINSLWKSLQITKYHVRVVHGKSMVYK